MGKSRHVFFSYQIQISFVLVPIQHEQNYEYDYVP